MSMEFLKHPSLPAIIIGICACIAIAVSGYRTLYKGDFIILEPEKLQSEDAVGAESTFSEETP